MTSECRDPHIEGMYDNNRPLSARLMRPEFLVYIGDAQLNG